MEIYDSFPKSFSVLAGPIRPILLAPLQIVFYANGRAIGCSPRLPSPWGFGRLWATCLYPYPSLTPTFCYSNLFKYKP